MIIPLLSHYFPIFNPLLTHDYPIIIPLLSHYFPIFNPLITHDYPNYYLIIIPVVPRKAVAEVSE